MSSRSISPSLPCDNDSELSSSMNEDVPEVLEGEFRAGSDRRGRSFITSAVRDICIFAVLCSVTQGTSCCVIRRNFKWN